MSESLVSEFVTQYLELTGKLPDSDIRYEMKPSTFAAASARMRKEIMLPPTENPGFNDKRYWTGNNKALLRSVESQLECFDRMALEFFKNVFPIKVRQLEGGDFEYAIVLNEKEHTDMTDRWRVDSKNVISFGVHVAWIPFAEGPHTIATCDGFETVASIKSLQTIDV
jgi:hypothetical protein